MSAPTLIIGIGGQGGRIVEGIAGKARLAHARDVEFVAMDTDVNDLDQLHRRNNRISVVQTSYRTTVGEALDINEEARTKWFPITSGLLGKSLTEGAGQVRAISRLAFDHAVENGKMRPLEKAIERLRALQGDPYEQSLRIMICGCLSGGTGSGIALPVAMYIRNFLMTRYQDQSSIIRGFFIEPDCLFGVITDEEERNNQRCNAYAAIREIDAFMRKQYMRDDDEYRHVVFNAPQPGVGRRMDYPNILPYNYVFLMDSMNLQGEHLPELDDYINHMADIIYTQTVGVASSRLNSTEDNFTRRLDQSEGRARYCGAGCSHLVYPYEDVKRYFGVKWAESAIAEEWLELDHTFQNELRDGDVDATDIDRAKSFVRGFSILRTRNKLYSSIGKDSVISITEHVEGEGTVDTELPIGRDYVDQLLAYADNWNESGLNASCGSLYAFDEANRGRTVPRTEPEVKKFADHRGPNWTASLDQTLKYYEQLNQRYYFLVASDVVEAAKLHSHRLFSIPETDGNPLDMLRDEHFIEHYFTKQGGVGAKHPLVVRYILNDAFVALTEELDKLQKDRDGRRAELSDIFDKKAKGRSAGGGEDGSSRGDEGIYDKTRRAVNGIQGKATVTDDEANDYSSKGSRLVRQRELIDAYRQLVVECEIFESALAHIKQLSSAYQGFFSYMEGHIPYLRSEAASIEERPEYNEAKGSPTRYVCASKICLEHMFEECPQSGSSSDLPPELCADIFRGVTRYAALVRSGKTQADRNDAGKIAYEDLFQRTVVDFWTCRLEDPALGYQSTVDKTVLKAVLDEAIYTKPSYIESTEDIQAYLGGHVLDVIDEAYDLALPYIMKPLEPVGEKPSNMGSCLYATGAFDGLGAFSRDVEQKLKEYNGIEVNSGEVDSHEILFSRTIYGFRAANLPHYTCEHAGHASRPAGEYHRAYWDIASQLSPDSKRNKYVTPHIDRRWHLIHYLPDISDEYQKELHKRIIRAYLFGLAAREFGSHRAKDGSYIFHLKTDLDQKQVNLMVSDGGRCDRFHEVFDALKYDPQVVGELIRRSNASLKKELGKLSSARAEYSVLVLKTRSKAYTIHEGVDQVVKAIEDFSRDEAALMGERALDEEGRSQFLSHAVTGFFVPSPNDYAELRKIRHSVFEVPVFYRISLPPSDLRAGEIEDMIDGIYESVRDYFAHFTSAQDHNYICEQFFKEQYLLFELNLPVIEAAFPETAWSDVVGIVREKVLSYFTDFADEVSAAQEQFVNLWDVTLSNKDNILRNRIAQAFSNTTYSQQS